jgi:hypothetical protein
MDWRKSCGARFYHRPRVFRDDPGAAESWPDSQVVLTTLVLAVARFLGASLEVGIFGFLLIEQYSHVLRIYIAIAVRSIRSRSFTSGTCFRIRVVPMMC